MTRTDRTLDVARPAGTADPVEPAADAVPAPRRPADADPADTEPADTDPADTEPADTEADPAGAEAEGAGTDPGADDVTVDDVAAAEDAATGTAETDSAETDTAGDLDDAAGPDDADDADDAGERSGASRLRNALVPSLVVAVVALAVLTGQQALSYQRARVRAAAELSVLAPAKTAAARILSYDYRHIEQDATAAAALLTGAFRGQYEAVMRQQIVPQAPRQRAVVQAEVLAAGVSGVSPDGRQAVVVVFANQTVSNTATTQPRVDQVRVRLTLDRVGETWLVSKVDAL